MQLLLDMFRIAPLQLVYKNLIFSFSINILKCIFVYTFLPFLSLSVHLHISYHLSHIPFILS
jgi:hypothetical protein